MDIPGNSTSTASLQIGGALSSSLEFAGDTDWIRVELVAGESYLFTLTGTGSNPLFDPFLELRDASGERRAQDDDAGPGLNPQLRFTAPHSGTYFLVARSYEDENQSATAGGYTLRADFGPKQNPLDAIDWGTKLASNVVDVFFVPAGQGAGGFVSDGWLQSQINAVMSILGTITDVANLVFNQAASAVGAEFKLVTSSDPGLKFAGLMGPPGTAQAGVGVFNTETALWSSGLASGTSGFALVMHEILHGLGFAHPHDNGGSSEVLQGVIETDSYGEFELNQGVFTNITYNSGYPGGSNPTHQYGQQGGPSALDIALLQQKYGANTSHNGANNIYTLTDGNQTGQYFKAIWDTDGVDIINYDGDNAAAIDLRAATLALEKGGGGFISRVRNTAGGFTIANGVVIENASGGSGNDTITGNGEANVLSGNDGNDRIDGGAGNDTLIGGAGADLLDGGDGVDAVDYSGSVSSVSADLDASEGAGGDADGDIILNIENLIGSAFADALSGSSADNILVGGDGADTIYGGFGDDTLDGDSDDDTVGGNAGRDFITGGDGNDTLHGFGSHDSLYGDNNDDDLRGGYGRDLLSGSSGNDIARGFEGDDRLFGGGGNDTLLGNDGNDSITGGGGADRLKGDAGDDTLNGRFGDDLVSGGMGDDLFEFRQGHGNDVYDDFIAGAGTDDAIKLIALGAAFDTFAEVIAAASDDGSHTTIDFGGGDAILLLNVTVADLHEDDFMFS